MRAAGVGVLTYPGVFLPVDMGLVYSEVRRAYFLLRWLHCCIAVLVERVSKHSVSGTGVTGVTGGTGVRHAQVETSVSLSASYAAVPSYSLAVQVHLCTCAPVHVCGSPVRSITRSAVQGSVEQLTWSPSTWSASRSQVCWIRSRFRPL